VQQAVRHTVAVVGDARITPGCRQEILAFEIGCGLVDRGYRLMTGGMGGVMEAAHRGARASPRWHDGAGVGLLPGSDPRQANAYVDIVVPTGMDHGRNLVVAQADALVAIGGGAGTLSEMAFAWIHKRLIIALRCSGWSLRLADQRIDQRIRYPDRADDRVFGADGAVEALDLIDELLPSYNHGHRRIA
jgi:hypothetical protein